jgi:hypothetical protein
MTFGRSRDPKPINPITRSERTAPSFERAMVVKCLRLDQAAPHPEMARAGTEMLRAGADLSADGTGPAATENGEERCLSSGYAPKCIITNLVASEVLFNQFLVNLRSERTLNKLPRLLS